MSVHLARTLDDAERLRPLWDRLAWSREEAEQEFFVARLRAREDVIGPFVVLLTEGSEPVAGLVARLEHQRLATQVGYRTLYAPRVRLLQVVDGGIVAPEAETRARLVAELRRALAAGEADVVKLPPLPVGSELSAAFSSLGGPIRRQPFIAPWTRRRLVLPTTFEDFVASRSPNTRWRIRRHARQVAAELGDELSVEVIHAPHQLAQLVRDAELVAASTYQRALGAGFADTPEQRAIARVGLERGWIRAWLLYHSGRPVAYWLCSLHRGTLTVRTTGFDDAYARHRIGIHLLMRLIADACADPAIEVLDFGPGDAPYKQQFSNESRLERNTVVFAPTARGVSINARRTAILGPAYVARRALDAANLTDRVRSDWRGRLRHAGTRLTP